MLRKVMIVDSDVDALGALASALRARGLRVHISSEVFDAVEQAYQKGPHLLLAAKELDKDGDLSAALATVPALADLPVLYLVGAEGALGPRDVRRADVDHIASRVLEVALRDSEVEALQEIRGNVQQMSLIDLVQLLAMNRRSGLLSFTTEGGPGEVRLSEGRVVDAVYRRSEGEKALFRMLGEASGQFVFVPGEAAAGRITTPTNALLMEAMRQLDEQRALREKLEPEALVFLANGPPSRPSSADSVAALTGGEKLAREVVVALQLPRSVDELCDELGASDLDILTALSHLVEAGKVESVALSSFTAPLAPAEQLSILRALVSRLSPKGFVPPPRLIIAASHRRMVGLLHAVRYIEGAVAAAELAPRAALPRLCGTLKLGEGVDLALIGLPVDETFSPLWALALPGAAAVVRVEKAGGAAFVEHCEAAELQVLEADHLVRGLDIAVPAQLAALVRGALEAAAGV